MKLSELKFKVITGTPGRNRNIIQGLINKGQVGLRQVSDYDDAKFIVYNARIDGKCVPWIATGSSIESFVMLIEAPEVTFQQALDLIGQVEMPEPEFPFKPFDRVVRGCVGSNGWLPDFFSHTANGFFYTIGSDKCIEKVAKFEGNESVAASLNTPEQWWEIRDGKPKLMRR